MNFLVISCYECDETDADSFSTMMRNIEREKAIERFYNAPFELEKSVSWAKLVEMETGDIYGTWSKDSGFETFSNGSILVSLEEWSEITKTDLKLKKAN